MAIAVGHRWPMMSNLQQSNGLDALFKSTSQLIFWKCDLNLPNMCFRLSIWPNGHRESQKCEFVKWILRTNEATGLIVCPLIELKRVLSFSARCLFCPGRTWVSSPKLVPTPLILLGTSPPRKLLLTFTHKDDLNLARVPLPSGFSMSRSKNWELRYFLHVENTKTMLGVVENY
jgi:hypothetical protein